jgi:formiminotetrahydrofolate cyclodeaminase
MSQASFRSQTLAAFIQNVGDKCPTPGGGAVASAVGALAAALGRMVVSYSIGKKNLEEHQPLLIAANARLERAAAVMLELADEDAAAYGAVNELSRLDASDPRRAELAAAQQASVQVPLMVAAAAVDLLRLFEQLAGTTNRHLRSDLGIAAVLARATVEASAWNVLINLGTLAEPAAGTTRSTLQSLRETAATLSAGVERLCAP